MIELLAIHPLSWESISCCILAAAIIGSERQLHGKPIGIRTSCLICLGTYLFVAMGLSLTTEHTDPSRVVGQVITGVGFLGAGVMFSRNGTVVGVTSAAAIWMLAAVGITIGRGYPWLGVKIATLTTLLLVGVNLLESSFSFLQQGVHRRLDKRKQNGECNTD
ncbi:MAG: MgtC/SapB family protein [SAR324 cluster bacterium]|nr:MgtC/SapB family protein [SAR324 cluster bacterium]